MKPIKQWQGMLTIWLAGAVVCAVVAAVLFAGGQSQALVSTFTVTTVLDAQDVNPGDGICETAQGNGVCSLRAAIQETNELPGADLIVLPAGIYTLTLAGALENQARYGDLDIFDDLTLDGAGAGITMIDGNQLDRVIDLSGLSNLVEISGVTIRNGNVDFPSHVIDGSTWHVENGGCLLSVASLTMRDSVVTGCRAGHQGGGIYAEQVLVLDNTLVSGNQAGEEGGGLFIGAIYAPPLPTVMPMPTPASTTIPIETPPTVPALPTPSSTPVVFETPIPELPTATPTWTPFTFETPTPRATPTVFSTPTSLPTILSDATVRNSVIENNRAIHGGGVYNQGLLTLTGTQVVSNTASALGGGLISELWAVSEGSVFAGNQAGLDGGGIFSSYWLTLQRTTVRNNVAGDNGGGVVNHAWRSDSAAMLILEGSTVSGNACRGRGGGIVNGGIDSANDFRQEHLLLINSTVSGNAAGGSGGGIYTGLGNLNGVFLDNGTITSNVADADGDGQGDGGGIFNRLGAVQLRNTVLAGNLDLSAAVQRPDCWTPRRLESRGYNLIGVATTCPLDGVMAGNLLGVDPQLGPLHDNGGDTQTHALLAGSPAIDGGNPAGCIGEFSGYLAIDQRGYLRPVDGNGDGQGVCDMGAYEFGSVQPRYRYLPLLLAH